MNKKYQSPEAVEVGSASEIVLGEKEGLVLDINPPPTTMPISSIVDVDD